MRPASLLGLAVGAAVAIGGLLIGQPILALVGVGVGLAAVLSGREGRDEGRSADPLGAEARSLVRPIEQARVRLVEIADRHRDRPDVSVIAAEAAREAEAVVERATEIALARQRLKATLRGRGRAETELGRIERLLREAKSEAERTALEGALASRREEIGQFDVAQRHVDALGASLRQAEAILGALTARVTASAVASRAEALDREGLESALMSVRTFGASLEEARAMIEEGRP